MKCWIVLIGAPATGKTTLSKLLATELEANCYSFDELFPLETFKNGLLSDSKHCRKELIKLAANDENNFVIIDDTCHLNSIQKQYVLESEKTSNLKVIFLYLSTRFDQINLLKARNLLRNDHVSESDIENISTKLGQSNFYKKVNFIEYNFELLPDIKEIICDLKNILKNYKWRSFEERRADSISDVNFYNRLNIALNREVSKYFQSSTGAIDGKIISARKAAFIARIKTERLEYDDVDSLVNQFRINNLS